MLSLRDIKYGQQVVLLRYPVSFPGQRRGGADQARAGGGGRRWCTVKKKCTKDRLEADMSGAGEESLDANQTMAASPRAQPDRHQTAGTRAAPGG